MQAVIPTGPGATRLYCGRFAPSPSGPLHIGSLFTALASFIDARSVGGAWHLRIDDIDPYRTVPGAAESIIANLEALGLVWDGPIVFQSQQTQRYRSALDALEAQGGLYPCTCSRKVLAQSTEHLEPAVYPGYCRHRRLSTADHSHALRIMTEATEIRFQDQLQGLVVRILSRDVGDFILYRRDGAYAYHLATAVDDAELGITHVVRGHDLLASTPRQIYLQQKLGLPTPVYSHVPVLVDPAGRKLSKRHLAPEAETRHTSALLCYLLELLQQSPPADLQRANAREILAWAIAHWDASPLSGLRHIRIDPTRFSI
ncbi:MAG: tRNA glutamyl-Q(34) synthetase GluQRS [Methylococcaceae bacterium]